MTKMRRCKKLTIGWEKLFNIFMGKIKKKDKRKWKLFKNRRRVSIVYGVWNLQKNRSILKRGISNKNLMIKIKNIKR